MSRPRIPKIEPTSRYSPKSRAQISKRELARIVFATGRIGLELRERGYDNSQVFFSPAAANAETLHQLNPTIPESVFAEVGKAANDYLVKNHSLLFGKGKRDCFPYLEEASLLSLIQAKELAPYFHSIEPANEDIVKVLLPTFSAKVMPHMSHTAKANAKGLKISRLSSEESKEYYFNSTRTPGSICVRYTSVALYYDDSLTPTIPLLLFSMKLSDFGKKAIMNYIRECEGKKIRFEIKTPPRTATISLATDPLQAYETLSAKTATNVLANTLITLYNDVTKQALSQFQDYLTEQEWTFNGIKVDKEHIKTILDSVRVSVFTKDTNYLQGVFKAIRDGKSIDKLITDLTSEDRSIRKQATITMALLKESEEDEDEEG